MSIALIARANEARSKSFARKGQMLASASAAIVSLTLVSPAHAQEDERTTAKAATEEIVITGSRIVRRDFTATSPIVTVDADLIEKSSSVNLEANLNKLPQFAPSLTQFNSDDIQSSANVTLGASTVSLRQLGSNRNLVLIDGRRGTPINGSGVIDINTIPSAAIQRVEIITGGASSTYGADAVGGVVNFILKKDFQGFELDGQAAISQYGDGLEYRVSAVIGANFDDGKGNVVAGVEHFAREEILRIDRPAYRKLFSSPQIAGGSILGLSDNNVVFSGNTPSQTAVDSVFLPKGAAAGGTAAGGVSVNSTFFLNNDDTLFINGSRPATTGPAFSYLPLVFGYKGPLDGNYRKLTAAGTITENNLAEVLSIPQDRYTAFMKSHYDFNEYISFFSQAMFAKTSTISVSQYAPATGGWGTLIPHGSTIYTGNTALGIPSSVNLDGSTNAAYRSGGQYGLNCGPTGGCSNSQVFPVSSELNTLLNSRTVPVIAGETPTATATRLANLGCPTGTVPGVAGAGSNCAFILNQYLSQLGERRTVNNNLSFQLLAGLNGRIPGMDWTWEVFGSYGETVAKTDQIGFGSVNRWRALVTAPNFGTGFKTQGNLAAPGNGFQGATATCATGVSPFKQDTAWSDDCRAVVQTNTQNENRVTQTQWQANLQGGLFNLPYGQLRFAAGLEYRKNTIKFSADSSATQGSSFLEGVIGIFPQGNTQGSTEVKEIYGELLVPVVSDLPFAKAINLELGYRLSDYSSIGSVGTYKLNGEWAVNDWLTFRGGYQKASRAPNLGELFTAATQTLGVAFDGDPCSQRNPNDPPGVGNYSATRAGTVINGVAAKGNVGGAAGAAAVQSLCTQIMGANAASFYYDPANINSNSSAGFGFAFLSLVGKRNLEQEDATTYTIGAVLQSPFDSPWLSRFRASVDYYHVKLTNAISQQGQDAVYRKCFSTKFNPTLAFNDFCGLISRDPVTGAASTVGITFGNGGEVETAGVDAQINWGIGFRDVGIGLPGSLNFNVLVNYLDKFTTTTDLGIIDAVDFAGTLGGGDVGTNAGAYRFKSFWTTTYSVGGLNLSVQWRFLPKTKNPQAATNPATTFTGAPAYNIFDLSATYAATRSISLRFGIDNLFNKQPPLYNVNTAATLPTLQGGSYLPGYYDTLGRRFYFGAKLKL